MGPARDMAAPSERRGRRTRSARAAVRSTPRRPVRYARRDSVLRSAAMDLGIHGRVALVAAGSKGLGKAIAAGLAREGCQVMIFSRDADGVSRAVADIRAE